MLCLRFFSLRVTRRRGLQGRCCLWMEVLPQGDRSGLSRRRKRGPTHQSHKKEPSTTGMPRANKVVVPWKQRVTDEITKAAPSDTAGKLIDVRQTSVCHGFRQ